MKRILACIALLISAGCSHNNVAKFYKDASGGASTGLSPAGAAIYSGATEIRSTDDQIRDGTILMRRGYAFLGNSSYTAGASYNPTEKEIREHAARIGADYVLVSTLSAGSSQAVIPVPQFHPGQTSVTYSSGNINSYASSGGVAARGTTNYQASSTTRTAPSTTSTLVPISVARYQFDATFWKKSKPPILGVNSDYIPNEVRQSIGRSSGAFLKLIIDDSPAFRANLLPGDVIVQLGDTIIETPLDLNAAVAANAGRTVQLRLIRSNTEKLVQVRLNPKSN